MVDFATQADCRPVLGGVTQSHIVVLVRLVMPRVGQPVRPCEGEEPSQNMVVFWFLSFDHGEVLQAQTLPWRASIMH